MTIEIKKVSIHVDGSELWNMAFYIKRGLLATAKEQYLDHQGSFERNEDQVLIILRNMYNALGKHEMYFSFLKEVKEIFQEHTDKSIKKD